MLILRLAEPSSWNGHLTIDCVPRNETPGSRFSKYLRIASGWKDVNVATPSCPVRRRTFGNRSREGASSSPMYERVFSLASCRFARTENDDRHLQISGRRRCSLTIHRYSIAALLPSLHEHFGLRIEHVALAFLPVRQAKALAVLLALALFALQSNSIQVFLYAARSFRINAAPVNVQSRTFQVFPRMSSTATSVIS